jgi:hypothetical protein
MAGVTSTSILRNPFTSTTSCIAERLSVNRNTVILWRKRFDEEGLDGLWDIAPGRGRKPRYQIDKIASIVDATLQTKPAGMTVPIGNPVLFEKMAFIRC